MGTPRTIPRAALRRAVRCAWPGLLAALLAAPLAGCNLRRTSDYEPFEPEPERCEAPGRAFDNDWDGRVDEGLDCCNGPEVGHVDAVEPCGVGACRSERRCLPNWQWSPCLGAAPRAERCDGRDEDCDGLVDEALAVCECVPGDTRECGQLAGVCYIALATCEAPGRWGECPGTLLLGAETCNGLDDDCDNVVDESMPVRPGELQGGVCRETFETCAGSDGWQAPDYHALPGYEEVEQTCDGVDNDCDGRIDEAAHLPSDPANCGACGRVCEIVRPGASLCIGGSCYVPCEDVTACGLREGCVTDHCTAIVETRLAGPDATPTAAFGFAVALDGNVLAISEPVRGAHGGSLPPGAGAVHVFERQPDDGRWLPKAMLVAHNPSANDLFGEALAVSGGRIVVGVPSEAGDGDATRQAPNDGAPAAGAVYVFERQADGAWSQVAWLKSHTVAEGNRFGAAVALDGDVLAVGETGEDGDAASTLEQPNSAGEQSGAVHVFERQPDGEWRHAALLDAPNSAPGRQFGRSVALRGGVLVAGSILESGDAESTLEAPNELARFAGAAWVFEHEPADGWRNTAYLKAHNADEGDSFGWAVAVQGVRIAVGAVREAGGPRSTAEAPDEAAPGAGAVYIFAREDGGWRQRTYLKAPNAGEQDSFGAALALSGGTLLVGAADEDGRPGRPVAVPDDSLRGSGAAYVFDHEPALGWRATAYLKAVDATEQALGGRAVATDGELWIVGSPGWGGDGGDGPPPGAVTMHESWSIGPP